MNIIILMMIFIILSCIMMILNFILSKKMMTNTEKLSGFECGFDPFSKSRLAFSMQYYLIATMFLIFDVEICMILPFINESKFCIYESFFILLTILLILITGLLIEWKEGALNWIEPNYK